MRIVDQGIVFSGTAGSRTASCAFPSLSRLSDGTLLAAWRAGSNKDSDDGTVWLASSSDEGRTWTPPREPFSSTFGGRRGELRAAYISVLGQNHFLATLTWIDRSHPNLPLFNPKTEGLLPAAVLFSESHDRGETWSPVRAMDDEPYKTPLVSTGPTLKLPNGQLACQFEVNKHYDDTAPWRHAAALRFSTDGGRTWPECAEVARDPTGRLFFWDARYAVGANGLCVALFWTYDRVEQRDVNIHMSESRDGGRTWPAPRDVGVAGQIAYPVLLSDSRLVMLYVDRFRTRSIRASLSVDGGNSFLADELTVYRKAERHDEAGRKATSLDYLQDMEQWTFGLVHGLADSNDRIWLVYYAGDHVVTRIHWAQLRL